jgi:hypothetical protein
MCPVPQANPESQSPLQCAGFGFLPPQNMLETDMNIEAIKAAVDAGQTVHWANTGYIVHKDALGQYLITYRHGGSTIGLTDQSGTRLNGDEAEFYVAGANNDL